MGILEELKKMDEQGVESDAAIDFDELEKEKKEEKPEQEETNTEVEASPESETQQEPEKEVEEKKHDPEEYYKQREAKRLRAENEELRAQMAAFMQQQQAAQQQAQQKQQDVVPDPTEDPDAYRDYWIRKNHQETKAIQDEVNRLKTERTIMSAKQELSLIESDYAKTNASYNDVVNQGMERLKRIAKLENPELDDFTIQSRIETAKVTMAAQAVKRGQNPAEALYKYMQEAFDIKPKSVSTDDTAAKNLDAVKKNKARSASPISGGGQTGQAIRGPEAAKKMTLKEFASLDSEEKSRIFM